MLQDVIVLSTHQFLQRPLLVESNHEGGKPRLEGKGISTDCQLMILNHQLPINDSRSLIRDHSPLFESDHERVKPRLREAENPITDSRSLS